MTKKLIIAHPHGFCAGVTRAIAILEKALEKFGAPIFVNHEIVHNEFLVKYFEEKGVVFKAALPVIPSGSVIIFSAHGIPPKYREDCEKKDLKIIDATCPLVLKVHTQAANFAKKGYKILMIGQKSHQEMQGTSGVATLTVLENEADIEDLNHDQFSDEKVVCLTQTTLSMDYTGKMIRILRNKIPHLEVATGICYASQNRQDAVKKLAKMSDFIIVIGSNNSSNSNKLVDTAKSNGCDAMLLDDPEKIPDLIYETVGLTSGASVPEELFRMIEKKIKSRFKDSVVEELHIQEENVKFPLPNELL